MSLYLIVLAMLVSFAVYEYRKGKTQETLYRIAFFVLGAMLCFRYAQGSDYYGYYVNYLLTPRIWELKKLLSINIHGEMGWRILCSLCRSFGMPFDMVVFFISLFEMYCIHRFVSRFCPLRTVALLLMYPTLYLTYTFSALRQGAVLLFFLGFMIDWFNRGKIKHYLLGTLGCLCIHSSALVFLVLFAVKFIVLDGKMAVIFVVLAGVVGIFTQQLLPKISSAFVTYADSSMSIVAVGERAVSLAIILYVFWDRLKDRKRRTVLGLMLQIYLYGCIIYSFLMWNALISARFNIYFKAVELMLFSAALKRPGRLPYVGIRVRDAVAVYLLALSVVLYFKNIHSYLVQGSYYEGANVFNYPWLHIFDMDAAEAWRKIPYDFSKYLN